MGQPLYGEVPAEMLQPRIARPAGENLRRLERIHLLAGQQSWNEVCTIADELLAAPADGWVAAGPKRFIGVRQAVHRLIAELPAEALAAYRQRVDPVASHWLEQARADRVEGLLRRVVDETFCSSAADDALWALGELALERGDYHSARAAWQRIHRATAKDADQVCPDATIPLAEVRARLALVSILEGDFERAAQEIAQVESEHPDALGRLGGREVALAEHLKLLFDQARGWPEVRSPSGDWPTLFANNRRTSVAAIELPSDAEFEATWHINFDSPSADTSIVPKPTTFPVIAAGQALFADAAGLHAMDLDAPVAAKADTLYASRSLRPPSGSATLTVERGKAFAVAYARSQSGGDKVSSQLIGLDLDRDGALLIQQSPLEEGALFVGTPVVVGSRVIVGEIAPGQGIKASVVCLDMWSGAVQWRRSLGWAVDAAALAGSPSSQPELAADAATVYVSTNLGMIAALRLDNGEPLWLHAYERSLRVRRSEDVTAVVRRPNPCVVHRGQIFCAPDDAANVIALDASTGVESWSTPLPEDVAYPLAADEGRVLLAGSRLWALDARTGKLDTAWGEQAVGGAGQATIAGELILWPTAGDIVLVDRQTGKSRGRTLALPDPGGANLVVGAAPASKTTYVLAAGPSRLTAYRYLAPAAHDRAGLPANIDSAGSE